MHALLEFKPSNENLLQKALQSLQCMDTLLDSPHYQFLLEQLDLLLVQKNGRRYQKNVIIFAAELFTLSPAAFRMVKKSGTILLPDETIIRGQLSDALCDENLGILF